MLATLTSSFCSFRSLAYYLPLVNALSALQPCLLLPAPQRHLPALRLGAAQLTYLRHVWALTFTVLRHNFLIKISLDVEKNLKTLRSVGPSGLPRAALDKRNSLLKSIEKLKLL